MIDLPKKRIIRSRAPAYKRALSFIVDWIIIQVVVISPLTGYIKSILPSDLTFETLMLYAGDANLASQLSTMNFILMLLVFAYFFLFEWRLQQTPGKMIFKQYIVSEDKKQKLTAMKFIIRNFSALPFSLFMVMWIIDPLYLIFTGRRLSDVLSKTDVVEEIEV